MIKLIDLAVPNNYDECIACIARQAQVNAILGLMGIADEGSMAKKNAEAQGDEKRVELNFVCLPQRTLKAEMRIEASVYNPDLGDGKPKKSGKPNKKRTLCASVDCDGRLAGHQPV